MKKSEWIKREYDRIVTLAERTQKWWIDESGTECCCYKIDGRIISPKELSLNLDSLRTEYEEAVKRENWILRQQQKKAERIAKQQAKQMRWQRRHFTSI